MIETIIRTIQDHQLLDHGDRVIVGLSGGPDSMVLLHVLWTLKGQFNLTLKAVHVNHGLRPNEADLDEAAAVRLCSQLDIPIEIIRVDVGQVANSRGISTELAGRDIRYEQFHRIQNSESYHKIALAHHADDQCETVLMRLLRGSGIDGLSGMSYKRVDGVIRPLLQITKAEVVAYEQCHQLGARIDSTNLETVYVRNRYRLELIPYLKESYNPNVVKAMTSLAEQMQWDGDFLSQQSAVALEPWMTRDDGICLPLEVIHAMHPAILTRVIRMAFEHIHGTRKDFSRAHVQAVMSLLQSEQGSKTFVFKNVKFSREYAVLRIIGETKLPRLDSGGGFEYQTAIQQPDMKISEYDINDKPEWQETDLVLNVDAECITGPLRLRHRQEGDRFSPYKGSGSKKLKDYFIDQKLPREKRDEVWLLADEVSIFWIQGFGRSKIGCLTDKTKRIIEIRMT